MFYIIQHGTGLAVGSELGAALVLELLVGHSENDSAVVAGLGLDEVEAVFFIGIVRVGPGVVHVNPGAEAAQFGHHVYDAGVAQIRTIFLEGETQHQDGSVHHIKTATEHELDDLAGNVRAHAIVDAAAGKNDFRVAADFLGLVGQVVGVDADAVATDETGAEREEVPFAAGGGKYGVGVEAEPIEEHGQFIDEGDVDVALGVFDDLGGFSDADAGGEMGAGGDDAAVESVDEFGGLAGGAGGDFDDGGQTVVFVAGVDAFGGVADEEVARGEWRAVSGLEDILCLALTLPSPAERGFPGLAIGIGGIAQAGEAFEDGNTDFLGAAGVDGGFVDNHVTGFEQGADGFAGADEGAEIGAFGCVDGSRDGDNVDVAVGEVGRIGCAVQMGGRLQFLWIGLECAVMAGTELFDALGLEVVADGGELLAEFDGKGEADITETDDADAGVLQLGYFCHIT